MAIVKCPECGHQVSDKAHTCPSCGVEIAENIVTCPKCGETYFKEEAECPHCHGNAAPVSSSAADAPSAAAAPAEPVSSTASDSPAASAAPVSSASSTQSAASVSSTQPEASTQPAQPQIAAAKSNSKTTIIVLSVLVLLAAAFALYFYSNSNDNKEQDAYEYALNSNDPAVLESYLDNYRDASQAHRDKISDLLGKLKQTDIDWTNAVVSGSKAALAAYLEQYPNSIHKTEAIHKMDSLDWALASSANTLEAYKQYLSEHPAGEHADEANTNMNLVKAKTVSAKEKEMIGVVFRNFFQSINARDDEGLTAAFSDFMTTFLGKSNASKSDVVAFLNKIYKDDITAMEWRAGNDFKIAKREIGIDEYEYSVDFSARQKIERTDPSKEKEALYRIKAKVNPDGKITELNMVKILE